MKVLLIALVVSIALGVFCAGQDKDKPNLPAACVFEPDWRPTHYHDSTLHVNRINPHSINITVGISKYVTPGLIQKNYTLDNSACHGDCPRWTPTVGGDYSATVREQVKYIPSCLKTSAGRWIENVQHSALPASREVRIGFGKMEEKTLQFGTTRSFEFYVWYDLPVASDDPLQHADLR